MESSRRSRFRFRDSTDLESASDDSSLVSSAGDDESKIESLTAKGIKRLCSELLELKEASEQDFHTSVYLNYSTFVRIFEQVGGIENELALLRQHVSTQRDLVKKFMDGMYLEILSKESIDSIIEESSDGEQPPLDNLEVHADAVLEALDTLLSEHRLDEALVILELEDLKLKMIHLEDNSLPRFLTAYESSISERKSRLAYKYARLADHPRIAAPEFQKALSGLCRLNDSQCATQLLLKYYRLRLENGVHDLRSSNPYFHRTYFGELAKFVFSVISQAARSFVLLYGEKSPYASELIQWAREETEIFVCYFNEYLISISDVNGGLATAVEAVQYTISFCSILETQRIVLRPFLVKLIRPSMEEVLKLHVNHYKKVIGLFTASDDWSLAKYLIPGILEEEASPTFIGHNMEYCHLTNSGRKFVTLLQAIMKEVFPLVILQLETSIFDGLLELFKEYIDNLERTIQSRAYVVDGNDGRIIQLSALANALALVHIVSITARSIFKDLKNYGCQLKADIVVESFYEELDNWLLSIQDVVDQLRYQFKQHVIHRVMSPEGGPLFSADIYCVDQGDSNSFTDLRPSVAFQVLFLELRLLEKVGTNILIKVNLSMEKLLRELMEALFVWLENNQDFWLTIEENSNFQQTYSFEQFILDMQFLVEITRFGGYCSSNLVNASLSLIFRMAAFLSAGHPNRDVVADEWATNCATEAIQKLLDTENTEVTHNKGDMPTFERYPVRHQCRHGTDSMEDAESFVEDPLEVDDLHALTAYENAITMLGEIPEKDVPSSRDEPVLHPYEVDVLDDEGVPSSINWSVRSGERTEITYSGNNEVLSEIEKKEEPGMGSSADVDIEAPDKNEHEKVFVEEGDESCFDDLGSATDELLGNVDAGAAAGTELVELSDCIPKDSEIQDQ
ncbi:Exocyst complex component exo84b [Thalictrum thalictroides]|uniref:Exocyst complex component exo84b n=1 Tax=Thalictrum thalictroides TaxID=46969 RepID=A0A7J6VMH9_THATH|nr:Exocyst complex component exo84b [Thalictrum thalictroides]